MSEIPTATLRLRVTPYRQDRCVNIWTYTWSCGPFAGISVRRIDPWRCHWVIWARGRLFFQNDVAVASGDFDGSPEGAFEEALQEFVRLLRVEEGVTSVEIEEEAGDD